MGMRDPQVINLCCAALMVFFTLHQDSTSGDLLLGLIPEALQVCRRQSRNNAALRTAPVLDDFINLPAKERINALLINRLQTTMTLRLKAFRCPAERTFQFDFKKQSHVSIMHRTECWF